MLAASCPTDDEYNDMIVKGWPKDEKEIIDKYLNMNLIFDVGTHDKRSGTVVKRLLVLDGREIIHLCNNPLFGTREYEIELTDSTRNKYTANIIP